MPLFRRKNRPRPRTITRVRWGLRHRRSHSLRFRQLIRGKVLVTFGVLALIVLSIYGFFYTNILHLKSVDVTTQYKDINPENLEGFISGKVLGINTFLLNIKDLSDLVYADFPEVAALYCQRRVFARGLACEAIGYELVAVIKHEGNKYYINENGVVIAYDERKLGLPIFDLILNPIYADLASSGEISLAVPATAAPDSELAEPVLGPAPEPLSLTEIILGKREGEPNEPKDPNDLNDPNTPNTPNTPTSLNFIQPFDAPPVEPVIQNEAREVFQVAPGKKILDPEELKSILTAIQKLEEVLQRRVIQAQYVQVAGELSLTSKPSAPKETDPNIQTRLPDGQVNPNAPNRQDEQAEDPEHELTFLLDLRRNLDEQFIKLKKAKEVIDFSEAARIDLSVDGEKVFYR